jgi:RNA polymerase sigma factor (sigma-70 family)
MQVMDDMTLLREYAARGSEAAFEELVSRRVNFVYSAALRQVRDPHLAGEITQAVFIILAQKAGRISEKTILTGWFFRTTRFAALAQMRAEAKRRQRELEVQMQSEFQSPAPDEIWNQMSPLLDEALASLGEKDRQAVLLRFFENKSLAEVGNKLGMGEDTARKRVSRALEKLNRYLAKRGVNSTTAIIAGEISANSIQAAPVALAKSVTAVAIAKGAAASGSTLTLIKGALKIMAWTKAKTAVVIGVGTLLATGTLTILLTGSPAIVAPQKSAENSFPALNLEGHFDDVFAGKHNLAGEFTVHSSDNKALVDITFENGFRQITGTDGRDSYAYTPGAAYISSGCFPTNGHFFHQLLSLVSVHDRDSLVDLQKIRLAFYKDYAPEEVTVQTQTNGIALGLASIRWYAPNYMHGTGTNRYAFTSYRKGWLMAELKISASQLVGETALPKEISYTQYQQQGNSVTNGQHIPVMNTLRPIEPNQIPLYSPDDVVPVEVATFSITQAQIGQPLSSYLPQITDDLVRVRDLRISNNKQVLIESRKWYDFPKDPSLVNNDGTLVFDASGKLRPMTRKDLQVLQKPAKTNQ